ncbi:acetyl-CoA C-acetyltransferase [Haloglycomyces albus]|uniref:acetyl-CoA C-acetyltransferase n=1 Tax=Haloglycomyces albus TaxID=526067 RepID=UPI00046D4552|nr:acetyl-CoA C-acetyltransferase [Haloglycomyces albus]
MTTIRPVAIVGGNRIPFAKEGGPYATKSNQDMLSAALDGLIDRFHLSGLKLDEFSAGAVLKHSRDFNLAREVVLGSRLDPATPAYDVQKACTTGMETAIGVSNKIALGQIDAGIAGGVDTTSDAPLGLNDRLRRLLLNARNSKSTGAKMKAVLGLRPSHMVPDMPRNAEPRTGLSMGEHAAQTAKEWGISRIDQDEFAATSHQRLAAAYEAGFFDDLLTPYENQRRDQILRPNSNMEKLTKLSPTFGGSEGTMTAGNSTPLSDGAATVLLSSDEWAREHDLPVLAHLVDVQSAAVDFVDGDDGLLTAPVFAVPRLLERNELSLEDFDFIEIHEAFASQVLATLKAWENDEFCRDRLNLDGALGSVARDRLNVNGSSLATGHPFAATGARIIATTAKLLHQTGEKGKLGLVSVCAAGGQGTAAIIRS